MDASIKMDAPDERNRLDDMAQGVFGQPIVRSEGAKKVTGRIGYAHDHAGADMAHGVLVRATIAKGRIKGMDTATVEAMDGVLAVERSERLMRQASQPLSGKAAPRIGDTVAYHGQPVALVVAETFEAARHAAQVLARSVDYEVEAVEADPEAVTPERPEGKASSQGDLDRAMADAAYSVDVEIETEGHNAAAIEPHASIAEWRGDKLELRGSYQMPTTNRKELADAVGVDPANVRILTPYVGGGFGSKLGVAPEAVAASIAARALGRPVAVALTRNQVFETVVRRSESRQRVRLAADGQGRLTGFGHEARVSQLPGEGFAEPVTMASPFMYRGENRKLAIEVARVARPVAGSVRSPGECIGVAAVEVAMDELAGKAGIDPVELRKRNIPETDPTTGKPFSSHRLADCLDSGARRFGWQTGREPASEREGEWLIGHGMASGFRINMMMPATARVRLNPDGTAVVATAGTDPGTGTYTVMSQLAGEMLGLDPDRVETLLGDSDLPEGVGSGGSMGACSHGTAVFAACEEIRRRIASRLGVEEQGLTLKDGEAVAGNRRIPLAEVLGGEAIEVLGEGKPGQTRKDTTQTTFGAYFCEVAVNGVTGETRVRRLGGTFAAGRIFNPRTARSQCLGGMVWGIGLALTEELAFDRRDGRLVNNDLAEYHVPVALDVPALDVELLEDRDKWTNPIQAKGIGELALCGSAGAVLNAIHNATGLRVRQFPATPDRLLAAFEQAERAA
ncbi:MAG: xanthine dehydrogenase family protein molybdopterin-binding subunit [Paracoccaceae bacterium]